MIHTGYENLFKTISCAKDEMDYRLLSVKFDNVEQNVIESFKDKEEYLKFKFFQMLNPRLLLFFSIKVN